MNSSGTDELQDALIRIGRRLESEAPDRLRHPDQQQMPEWGGADTCITSDFVWEPEDPISAHDLLVRTRHAVELTWLFFELRDAFRDWLDAGNKYGFFGSLASAAIRHLGASQPEIEDHRPLLRAVLAVGFNWQQVVRESDELPANPSIVLHLSDAEGRQRRIDLETNEDTN